MRSKDIVNQIALVLPTQVNDFTTQISVDTLTRAGTIATATTLTAHGLSVGQQVNMNGAQTPIVIIALTRAGIVATLVTETDHDMTENAGFDVQIEGAGESEFNGTFDLLRVPNRRTITFQVADSGPLTATGSPLLLNGSNIFATYNGLREITAVPTTTAFEYTVTDGIFTPASGTIVAKTNPRISSAVRFDRLMEAYTKQQPDVAWLFVVMGDAVASKNRQIDIDSVDNLQIGHYFNQRIIQSVSLYVFIPSTNEISGTEARDRCEELLKPICNSVLGFRFPSLVENSNNPLMLTGHGLEEYNTAFYVHHYAYEATLQLGQSDVFVPAEDVAARDICFTMGLDVGTETFDTFIDLDDEEYIGVEGPLGMYTSSFGDPFVLIEENNRGGLIRVTWKVIEPTPDVYDFSAIDALVQQIRDFDSKWSLAVVAGGDSPDWLIDIFGVEYFDIVTQQEEIKRLPKMWAGPIPNQRLALLLAALGERYDGDKDLQLVYVPQFTVNGTEGHFNGVGNNDLIAEGYTAEAWTDGSLENLTALTNSFPLTKKAIEFHEILNSTEAPDAIMVELEDRLELRDVGIAMWWLSGKTSYQGNLIISMQAFDGDKYSQVIGRSDEVERFENEDYTTIFTQGKQIGLRYIEAWPYEFEEQTFPAEFADFNEWADANFQ